MDPKYYSGWIMGVPRLAAACALIAYSFRSLCQSELRPRSICLIYGDPKIHISHARFNIIIISRERRRKKKEKRVGLIDVIINDLKGKDDLGIPIPRKENKIKSKQI